MTPTIPDTAELFKALGDDTRLKILKAIWNRNNCLCAGAVARRLELSPSAVSQQLKVLRNAGLVKAKRSGYHMHYSLITESLSAYGIDLAELLGSFGAEWKIKTGAPYARGCRDEE